MNVPSFLVRVDSQKHIDFALKSPFGGGRPGRVKRRSLKYAPAGHPESHDEWMHDALLVVSEGVIWLKHLLRS